jgi:hypothetical protein
MRHLVSSLLLAFSAGCFAHRTSPVDSLPHVPVSAANVQSTLRPGDFLFRYADPSDPVDGQVINALIHGGQSVAQGTSDAINLTAQAVRDLFRVEEGRFARALASGNPNAVHMAIYLGDGRTAEAFGTGLDDAKVNTWSLFAPYRLRTTWRVLRHRDPQVASAVVAVARRWATGRMTYRVPMEVFVRDAAWGAGARTSALEFATSFEREGGPPSYGNMFCSQFAVAALQSAVAQRAIVSQGRALSPSAIDGLPAEARIDAVASPLRVYTEWSASGAFEQVGRIVIAP